MKYATLYKDEIDLPARAPKTPPVAISHPEDEEMKDVRKEKNSSKEEKVSLEDKEGENEKRGSKEGNMEGIVEKEKAKGSEEDYDRREVESRAESRKRKIVKGLEPSAPRKKQKVSKPTEKDLSTTEDPFGTEYLPVKKFRELEFSTTIKIAELNPKNASRMIGTVLCCRGSDLYSDIPRRKIE